MHYGLTISILMLVIGNLHLGATPWHHIALLKTGQRVFLFFAFIHFFPSVFIVCNVRWGKQCRTLVSSCHWMSHCLSLLSAYLDFIYHFDLYISSLKSLIFHGRAVRKRSLLKGLGLARVIRETMISESIFKMQPSIRGSIPCSVLSCIKFFRGSR